MKRVIRFLAASTAAVFVIAASPQIASAHAVIPISPYRVAIGWQFEPVGGTATYAGSPNAIQVFVDQPTASSEIGTPVGDLNADCTKPDFTVTVSVGSTTSSPYCPAPSYDPDIELGRQDEYDYPLTPTAVGAYTFHIKGNIHGVPIDKTIASGPSTFDAVAEVTSSDFPVSVPPISTLSTKINAVDGRSAQAQSAADSARNTGLMVGGAGIVLALISIGIAFLALRKASAKT